MWWFVSPQQRDKYLSTLSHHMHMMLQMLWMMATMPFIGKFVAQVSTEKVWGLHHFVLAKKWGVSPKKIVMICSTTQHDVCTVLHLSLSRWFRTKDYQLQYRSLLYNVYSDPLVAIVQEMQQVHTYFCDQFWLIMLIPNETEKWSTWGIVPYLSVGWGATCNNMWQCQRNDHW